jgi:hypothetical protein
MAFTTEEHEVASTPGADDNVPHPREVEKGEAVEEGGGVLIPQPLALEVEVSGEGEGEGAAGEEIDAMGEGIRDLGQWLLHLHLTPTRAASIRSVCVLLYI